MTEPFKPNTKLIHETLARAKKSQRTRAEDIRREYETLLPVLDKLQRELRNLLDEAQNGPPHGGADGTLINAEYNAYRVIESRTGYLIRAMDKHTSFKYPTVPNDDFDELP